MWLIYRNTDTALQHQGSQSMIGDSLLVNKTTICSNDLCSIRGAKFPVFGGNCMIFQWLSCQYDYCHIIMILKSFLNLFISYRFSRKSVTFPHNTQSLGHHGGSLLFSRLPPTAAMFHSLLLVELLATASNRPMTMWHICRIGSHWLII